MPQIKPFRHTAPRLVKPAAPPEPRPLFAEPSLFYDPPYERPLEDEFAWQLVKYLEPITGLQYQVKVATPCANVWVDFVVEHGARRIGFEIGTLEEPSDDALPGAGEARERYRDALVLGSGALDVLYRFRGADLFYRPADALYLASLWDPVLFTERGCINLHTLASHEARAARVRPHDTRVQVTYNDLPAEGVVDGEAFSWPEDVPSDLVVRRLSRAHPAAWMRDYDAALAHFGVSEDHLLTPWAKSA